MNEKVPDRFEVLSIGASLVGLLVAILSVSFWLVWAQIGSGDLRDTGRSGPDAEAGASRASSQDHALLAVPPDNLTLQIEQRFSKLNLSAPESVCGSFAPTDQPDARWHQSTWRKSQWECFANFGPGQASDEDRARSPSGNGYELFIILRGSENLLQSLRIKLNLENNASRTAGFARFHALYQAVGARLGILMPPVFLKNIDTKDWAQFVDRDSVATWSKEYGEPPRYDFTIDFTAKRGKYFRFVEEPSSSLLNPNPAGSR